MLNKTNGHAEHIQALALESVANAVMVTDRDGSIEWVNPAFTRLSGYGPDEVIGQNPRMLRSGAQPADFYADLWSTVLAGREWRGELVERHKDGHLYTVAQTITPMIDDEGAVTHFVAVHDDVSDLKESQRRLQALFDHSLDAILLAGDDGTYLDANPAACELTGYTREELLTMTPPDLAAPERSRESVTDQFEAFLVTGDESGTFPIQHKSGRVVETEYRAVADILPGVHLSVVRDVTRRNASIRAFAASERRFHELADNASDVVVIVHVGNDLSVTIDYVNPATAHMFGQADPDRHKDRLELLASCHPEDIPTLDRLMRTRGPQPARGTLRFQHADGRWIWLEAIATVTSTSETHRTIQVIARDITERQRAHAALTAVLEDQRKAAQALEDLNDTKDQLLHNLSHELRTPLTVILGFAATLTRGTLTLDAAQLHDYHELILRNARRLKQLLDDLLDIDRSMKGGRRIKRTPTDLSELVRVAAQQVDLGDRTVDMDLEPVVLAVHAPRVRRILDNLLDNVARHTPPGTHVAIALQQTPEGAQLIIEDDGPGIPASCQHLVFEPFHQGDDAGHDAQPGAGLGLTLVQIYAQEHDGKAWIDPAHTSGTRIHITIAGTPPPAAPPPDHADTDQAEAVIPSH